LPAGLVQDGELVAWKGSEPYLPVASSLYRPNDRGWVKVKTPTYWRRDSEREAMARKHERRARTRV
jgi:hypothetical protein